MTDLRYALRTLRNHPGFALVTVTLIALGIGASGVIFSAVDAVMLRRLPVRDPERLFRIVRDLPQLGRRSDFSEAVYTALVRNAKLVKDVTADGYLDLALTDPGPAELIRGHFVSENYFASLGVNARFGRVLSADDTDAVVLSHGFWQRRFAGDPRVVGRKMSLRGQRFTIAGILPKEFNGFSIDTAPDVRLPLRALPLFLENQEFWTFDLAVRLRPGVTAAQAAAEINSIWRAVMQPELAKTAAWQLEKGVELDPLDRGVSAVRVRFSGALMFLSAAVGLLLLMTCANVAGLLLARSAARKQEISVRLALGASRWRLVRAMLTEALLLAVIGGLGGITLTYIAAPLLIRALPSVRDFGTSSLPLALQIQPNARVLAFCLLLSVATAVLFGLAPAIQASRGDLHSTLRAARASSRWHGRGFLVIFEVALCTLLLAAAGLLVRTFEKLRGMDAGFDRDHVVTFTMNPELSGYTQQQTVALRNALLARVHQLGGVRSAAVSGIGLMRGSGIKSTIARTGQKTSPADFLNSSLNFVTPDYFETMGMRIVAGRGFTDTDKAGPKRTPVLVNQTFVSRFFPSEDPIGKTAGKAMKSAIAGDDYQIVGAVTDARYRSLREAIQPTIYEPGPEFSRFILHVRTGTQLMHPESIIGPVRDLVRSLDPQLPISEIHTLAEEVDATLWSERLLATLSSLYGAIAAMVATIGLYGLLAYSVAQRTREIGIRVALGAQRAAIFALVGRQAAVLVASGAGIGLAGTLLVMPLVRYLLYGIAPQDGLTLASSVAAVALIGTIATAIPVVRALRIDAGIALRQD